MTYDIIIIGAGPAGLTAAIYARRAEKSVLVIEKETFGGQITHSPKVENYPGFIQMSGNEFAEKLIEQALNLETEITFHVSFCICHSFCLLYAVCFQPVVSSGELTHAAETG